MEKLLVQNRLHTSLNKAQIDHLLSRFSKRWINLSNIIRRTYPDTSNPGEMVIKDFRITLNTGDYFQIQLTYYRQKTINPSFVVTLFDDNTKKIGEFYISENGLSLPLTDEKLPLKLAKMEKAGFTSAIVNIKSPDDFLIADVNQLLPDLVEQAEIEERYLEAIDTWAEENKLLRIRQILFPKNRNPIRDQISNLPNVSSFDIKNPTFEPETILDSNLPRIFLKNGDMLIYGYNEGLTINYFRHDSDSFLYLGSMKFSYATFYPSSSKRDQPICNFERVDNKNIITNSQLLTLIARINFTNNIDKIRTANSVSLSEVNIREYLSSIGTDLSEQSIAVAELDSGSNYIGKLNKITETQNIHTIFEHDLLKKHFPSWEVLTLERIQEIINDSLPIISVGAFGPIDKGFFEMILEEYGEHVDSILSLLLETNLLSNDGGDRYEIIPVAKKKLQELLELADSDDLES